jgi:hypothetical protein
VITAKQNQESMVGKATIHLTLLFCSGVAGMFHHGIPWISDTPM